MDVPKKNFVGELQERCQLARTALPKYLDESSENNFMFTCQLNDWVCQGMGTSKRFAKQNAAKQMLDKIENGKLLSNTSEENKRSPQKTSSVSKLLEYCSKEKEENPLFSDLPKEGDLFCCKCSLKDFSAVGKGNSKKEAKENVAYEVAEHFGVHKYYDDLVRSKERTLANIPSVQELSMFCQKKHLAAPIYEEEEIKENNLIKYKVSCSVGDLKEESSLAHSKKSAKYEVATLLLQTLKSNTPQASPASNTPQASPASNTPQASPASNTPQASPASNTPQASPASNTPQASPARPVLKRKLSESEEPFLEPLKKHTE